MTDMREAVRRTCFRYDDGVVLCATLYALDRMGLLGDHMPSEQSLDELVPELSPSGFGYLRVALRTLAAQGWLAEPPGLVPSAVFLRWTDEGRAAIGDPEPYVRMGRFLSAFDSPEPSAWTTPWTDHVLDMYEELIESLAGWRHTYLGNALTEQHCLAHLEGALVIPTLLHLQASDALSNRGPVSSGGRLDRAARSLLQTLGYLAADGSWTSPGQQLYTYVPHLGMVGSYLPLFARLSDLYGGKLVVANDDGAPEWHVNRSLNVVASGAAHSRYFADADQMFLEVFDRTPLDNQPRFVADMGCGDGTWLARLYRLIRTTTVRGSSLDTEPLLMVGIDVNQTALDEARRVLRQEDVPAILLTGDVTDPEGLRLRLREIGLAIEDGLHIRSFIDHNREYRGADDATADSPSTGASVDGLGHPLSDQQVGADLTSHLRRWLPHVRKHGMVILEAHSIPPTVAQRHVGTLHSIAFDAYHGYSHQLLVDHATYVRCCRAAGLERVPHLERHYPATKPFVAISVNRLVPHSASDRLFPATAAPERFDTWRPDPSIDVEDGEALHRLLFDAGDLYRPRTWCAAPTGVVVRDAAAEIVRRLRPGATIRVLDYGAGTGLATIELVKACRDLGLADRLTLAGAELEIHLVDIPSSWFAGGHQLLRTCPWTRFHSARADDGTFRDLIDVTGGRTMDVVLANMVFHLIPRAALDRLAASLAGVTAPAGRLVWSSPDLGPADDSAVLFHDPNRLLRRRWTRLVTDGRGEFPPPVRRALAAAAGLTDADRARATRLADRRILPIPNSRAAIVAALSSHFTGTVRVLPFEMSDDEFVDAILVPANQREYIPEVADDGLRGELVRWLMTNDVLPSLTGGPAGTERGLNVEWTFGSFTRR